MNDGIPRGWRATTIGEQATLQRGVDITKTAQRNGRIPVISSGGVSSYHDEAAVRGPGVILGRKGVVGSVYFVATDYWPHDTTLWVKDFHGNDPHFVYYFFKRLAPQIAQMDVGSANPTLNRNHVHPIRTIWPPVHQQEAIANVLGTLDDKIELNRRMNQTLEQIARAIFKSWFVDFDPVRAKAEGRRPPGLDPETAALFPDSFTDSPLGPIPKGWRVASVSDVSEINSLTLGKNDALDIVDYVEISEVTRGEVGRVERYARGTEPSRARRRLRHGDTVLSTVRPDRGAYFLALHPRDSLIVSTGFAVLSPRDSNWAFLHVATTTPEFGEDLGHLADGGAYPAIRPEVIGGRELVIPDDPRLTPAFDTLVQPLLLKAELNRIESRTLGTIRDALLPKLLSGEIRVLGGAMT